MTKFLLILCLIFFNNIEFTFADANNSQLTTREQQVQDSQNLKKELDNSVIKPNDPSTPTQFQYNTNNIDPNVSFEINNHLFGYSTIITDNNTFTGIKVTGILNIAYYTPTKENDGTRKTGRFAFGYESPIWEISRPFAIFGGFGATLGDSRGIYVDVGFDYRLFQFLKAQAGFNYNTDGKISPQISIGLTW
ncbi:MAG TPA: hypothetical protein PLJ21_09015 [Pseudobdellovibrionaceae bacterium]|nr:hypothetical protein [Pseudobdellovibrionaceae bacterium]